MTRHSLFLGYVVLALAQVSISVNVVTSKFLIASLPMFFILAARFGVSSSLLGLTLLSTRTPLCDPRHPNQKLSFQDWFLCILSGIFAAFLFNIFFLWGLQHTTATASGIVGSTLPAIVAISAVWLLHERLNSAKIFALLLAMLGILIINLDHFEGNSNAEHTYFGDFLIFIAMLPEAWYSIIMRKLAHRFTPLGSAFVANLVGALTFLPFMLLTAPEFHFTDVTTVQWGFVLLAGLSSLLFFCGWGWGLTFISASTAGIFGGVMPVATTLLAIAFLGETLRWYDTVGMGLVILSIVIGTGMKWRFKKVPITAKS